MREKINLLIESRKRIAVVLKALFVFLCVAAITALLPADIYADEISPVYINKAEGTECDSEETDGILRVNEVCGGLPYHKMIARGTGDVYLSNGSVYLKNKPCWQCANCHLVMVTEGDIYYGEMSVIGKWATCSWSEPLTSLFVVINPPSATGTCNSNKMSGYKFFLYTG